MDGDGYRLLIRHQNCNATFSETPGCVAPLESPRCREGCEIFRMRAWTHATFRQQDDRVRRKRRPPVEWNGGGSFSVAEGGIVKEGYGTTHFDRLLDRIRAGEASAADDLIRDSYWRVHRRAHFILRGSFPDAGAIETDDVVSLSLENFARRLGSEIRNLFDNPAALFKYVDVIIRRVAIDEIRRRAGPSFRLQFPGRSLPEELAVGQNGTLGEGVYRRLSYEELVESLPEDEQQLINYRYIRDMTDEEIAAMIGASRRTVARRMRVILLNLRAELKALEGDQDDPA
jgi:RNA polymerase sigma factor (sigma-70 family)